MDINGINTVADLCQAAGEALDELNVEMLNKLQRKVQSWLIDEHEREIYSEMIERMKEAADELNAIFTN